MPRQHYNTTTCTMSRFLIQPPNASLWFNNLSDKFTLIDHLFNFLDSEFESELTDKYNVGYFEGRSHSKRWLVSDDDLQAMYVKFSTGSRTALWCENVNRNVEQPPPSKKRKGPVLLEN